VDPNEGIISNSTFQGIMQGPLPGCRTFGIKSLQILKNMKTKLYIILCLIVTFSSCKKDTEITKDEPSLLTGTEKNWEYFIQVD